MIFFKIKSLILCFFIYLTDIKSLRLILSLSHFSIQNNLFFVSKPIVPIFESKEKTFFLENNGNCTVSGNDMRNNSKDLDHEQLYHIKKNYLKLNDLNKLMSKKVSEIEKYKIARNILELDNVVKPCNIKSGGLMNDWFDE